MHACTPLNDSYQKEAKGGDVMLCFFSLAPFGNVIGKFPKRYSREAP